MIGGIGGVSLSVWVEYHGSLMIKILKGESAHT